MARSLWNVRKRHESLSRPIKKRRVKRRTKARTGILAAEQRRAKAEPSGEPPSS